MIIRPISTILLTLTLSCPAQAYAQAYGKPDSAPALGFRSTWGEVATNLDKMHTGDSVSLSINMGWDPEKYRPTYDQLRARSVSVRLVLAGNQKPGLDEWGRHVGAVAQAFPDAQFSLWNEPNIKPFGSIPVDYYAEMVRRARQAAPAADLRLGGMGPGRATSVGSTLGWTFLSELRKRHPDVFGLVNGGTMHVYEVGRDECRRMRCALKRYMNVTGFKGSQIGIAEYGAGVRDQVSPKKQARWMQSAYRKAAIAGVEDLSMFGIRPGLMGSGTPEWQAFWNSMSGYDARGNERPTTKLLRREQGRAQRKPLAWLSR